MQIESESPSRRRGRPPTTQYEQLLPEVIRFYEDGGTFREIPKTYGGNAERWRAHLRAAGVVPHQFGARHAVRLSDILERWHAGETVLKIATALGSSPRTVAARLKASGVAGPFQSAKGVPVRPPIRAPGTLTDGQAYNIAHEGKRTSVYLSRALIDAAHARYGRKLRGLIGTLAFCPAVPTGMTRSEFVSQKLADLLVTEA